MRNVAIIPARGGSKRLPRKNIIPFQGKPMLMWTAQAALEADLFEHIIISTEDPEIAEISKAHGFDVLWRDERLATDDIGCGHVCLEVVRQLQAQGKTFDTVCCLYATAPLRNAEDIRQTMKMLGTKENNTADFAFAITEYGHSPYNMLTPDSAGYLGVAWPLLNVYQSQDLPVPVVGNGSTYAARIPAFLEYGDFYGPRLKGYLMPKIRSIDIDTHEDFALASLAAQSMQPGVSK